MTRPLRWNLKTWMTILSFLGIGSLWQGVKYAQAATGWLATPTIEKAQARGLAHMDSALERNDARHASRDSAILAEVKAMKRLICEMPQAKDAAKRIRQREENQQQLFGAAAPFKGVQK